MDVAPSRSHAHWSTGGRRGIVVASVGRTLSTLARSNALRRVCLRRPPRCGDRTMTRCSLRAGGGDRAAAVRGALAPPAAHTARAPRRDARPVGARAGPHAHVVRREVRLLRHPDPAAAPQGNERRTATHRIISRRGACGRIVTARRALGARPFHGERATVVSGCYDTATRGAKCAAGGVACEEAAAPTGAARRVPLRRTRVRRSCLFAALVCGARASSPHTPLDSSLWGFRARWRRRGLRELVHNGNVLRTDLVVSQRRSNCRGSARSARDAARLPARRRRRRARADRSVRPE